jgi:hypothetical protein
MSAGAAAHSESQRARDKAEDLRRRADRLEERAAKFEQGHQGELAVAEALRRLVPAGFAVVNDIRWPGTSKANIDHVVFGPPGMFVVDAKNWTGKVVVKDGVLRQNGYHRRPTTEKTMSMALSLQSHLSPSVGTVRPIVCMANQPELDGAWCGSTFVVGLNRLGAWLFAQPALWPATHVDAVAEWLPHVLQPADPRATGRVIVTQSRAAGGAPPPTPGTPMRSAAPSDARPPAGRHGHPRESGLYGWLRGR